MPQALPESHRYTTMKAHALPAALPHGGRSGRTPWRPLAALAVLVFGAHLLVLQAAPDRLGSRLEAKAAKGFNTRSIALQPAAPAAQPAPTAPAAVPVMAQKMAQKPVPKKSSSKKPAPYVPYGFNATEFVADKALKDTPSTLAEPATQTASTPLASTPTVATISALPLAAPPAAALQADPTPAASAVASAAPSAGPQPTVVTAINLPSSARLQYKVVGMSKGLNYFADAELDWRNNGSQYDAAMKVSALFVGSRSMTSSGAVTPTGLAPTRFADKYKSEQAAHFDADKGKVTFSANTPDVPWMGGAQDRVSVFLQLGGMLAAGPGGQAGFAVGSSITAYTVGPRDADTWTFVVEATEQLSLPGGDMAAVKLTRKPRREYDQTVEVWYAPSLGYLPVRNRITQANGDFIDQQLKAVARP